MKQFAIGIIGLGCRGQELMGSVFLPMENVRVDAVCDEYEDRCAQAAEAIRTQNGNEARTYTDYRALLRAEHGKIDAVYIATSWQTHYEIAICALEAGIPVACEVSCAFALDECWELVKTYQRTQTPLMMMENCCYGREELMVLNMLKKGVFGKIAHCDGAYCHDLRKEVSFGRENRHYRLANYKRRNCENYPTHELGPIAQLLNVNRGNRIVTVSSTGSAALGLAAYIESNPDADKALLQAPFCQSDIVTTVLKCANGETIRITLDTTLPRAYSRGLTVHGTKAMYAEDNQSLFIDGVHNEFDANWKAQYGNIETYRAQYEHPVWQKFLNDGVQGGHGGMDWLQFEDFFACLAAGREMPIDVYDMAVWTAVSILSEQSIALGGQPLPMPDFTCGKWLTRAPLWQPEA